MDDLKPLAVFAEVVDAGSMSGAARRLGMSPSAVSQTIRALEQHGGVTLLHRSTRKLALTEAGERYYPHCQRMLEAARAAAQSLQQAREAPTGELRVSAPVGFANHLAPALAPFLAEAPQLRLRLLVDDAMIDLIDARIDVAIRIGRLADSSWIARKLCDFETILCASPDYLARAGVPAAPLQLPAHQWLAFGRELSPAEPHDGTLLAASATNLGKVGLATSQPVTRLLDARSADGEHHRLHVQARIASNNQISLQQMCEHGLGIAHLAYADAAPALARGALVHLLPQWRFGTMPVWAVTPRRDEAEAAKVRGAVDVLKRYFAALPVAASAAAA
ncbi:LysR family transcriptional regulator [Scleromatobacter humisilvae]|uniref:LysR family transcriptional regulator n=1 Tax=Scleromatobacter humisilvae TaxID=2897159 RepID=A0A9X1YEH8_9BURK|nr:LysR family transcriptional regulator [Scleromatobacter humisilvae]MCK9684117.1 LysR family transcriptional regulator [Scleromatobacter humisilvae]